MERSESAKNMRLSPQMSNVDSFFETLYYLNITGPVKLFNWTVFGLSNYLIGPLKSSNMQLSIKTVT